MKYEYIKELFPDMRHAPYPYGERNYKGFDARETTCMDGWLVARLYECLRHFQDVVSDTIDLEHDQIWIDDKWLTQRECIDRMVMDCKVILQSDEFREQDIRNAAKNDLFKILSACYWSMWW